MQQIWYLCSGKFSIADIGTKAGRGSPGTTKSTKEGRVRGHTLTTSLFVSFFTLYPPFSSLTIQVLETSLGWGWPMTNLILGETRLCHVLQQRAPVRFLKFTLQFMELRNFYIISLLINRNMWSLSEEKFPFIVASLWSVIDGVQAWLRLLSLLPFHFHLLEGKVSWAKCMLWS